MLSSPQISNVAYYFHQTLYLSWYMEMEKLRCGHLLAINNLFTQNNTYIKQFWKMICRSIVSATCRLSRLSFIYLFRRHTAAGVKTMHHQPSFAKTFKELRSIAIKKIYLRNAASYTPYPHFSAKIVRHAALGANFVAPAAGFGYLFLHISYIEWQYLKWYRWRNTSHISALYWYRDELPLTPGYRSRLCRARRCLRRRKFRGERGDDI